ncbi:MAG: SpoIIE family protein phosphatase [Desulfovibrionaceae bacterium]
MPQVDCHLLTRSMTGPDNECGDTGFVHCNASSCFIALVDILGHGAEAHEVALLAHAYLAGHFADPLGELILGLHDHLRGSRGGVASLCRLDIATGMLSFTGVGNITCRIFGADQQRLLARDGIVGYMMKAPPEKTTRIYPGDVVMLSSDGVREHFDLHDHPGLLLGTAREIAQRVMASLAKADDDASCVVMRYLA